MSSKPNNASRRVVVTGLGAVTPLGLDVEATWAALCAGKSGMGTITRFDTEGFTSTVAAQVSEDFDAEKYLSKKEARRTPPHITYSLAATQMALEDAGLSIDESNADRVGVFLGCGLGGLDMLEKNHQVFLKKGPKRVTPFFIPLMIGNMAPGMIAIQTGAKGPNCSVATACAAGSHAIGESARLIVHGDADVMICGGVESTITPLCVAGFCSMRALSTRNDEPQKACRPFDRDRDGFVVGEGSGILIIESLEHAQNRGAEIYAEIVGYGLTGDAHHMTAPDPEGDGMARCMEMAVKDAGLAPEDVGYINAHGTGTPLNDATESRAIKTAFGKHAYSLAVSSTKSMTGHLLGGAGGVEGVFSVLTINRGIIPPTINLDNPDPSCDLDYVPHQARQAQINVALSNSFGFGGTNAALVFAKFL